MKRSSLDAGLEARPQDRRHSVVPDSRPTPPKISKARACEYSPFGKIELTGSERGRGNILSRRTASK